MNIACSLKGLYMYNLPCLGIEDEICDLISLRSFFPALGGCNFLAFSHFITEKSYKELMMILQRYHPPPIDMAHLTTSTTKIFAQLNPGDLATLPATDTIVGTAVPQQGPIISQSDLTAYHYSFNGPTLLVSKIVSSHFLC